MGDDNDSIISTISESEEGGNDKVRPTLSKTNKKKRVSKTVARIKKKKEEKSCSRGGRGHGDDTIIKPTYSHSIIMKDVIPEGMWRYHLFNCCDILFTNNNNSSCLFWTTFSCPW